MNCRCVFDGGRGRWVAHVAVPDLPRPIALEAVETGGAWLAVHPERRLVWLLDAPPPTTTAARLVMLPWEMVVAPGHATAVAQMVARWQHARK